MEIQWEVSDAMYVCIFYKTLHQFPREERERDSILVTHAIGKLLLQERREDLTLLAVVCVKLLSFVVEGKGVQRILF